MNTLKRKDTLMTEGVTWKQLTLFAVPLLIGNLFQQFYNLADSVVVGNFVGKEALAAVGSTGTIINTLIGFFLGLSMGGNVVISQYFGAKDDRGVHDAVHTTLFITLSLSVFFTIVGYFMVPNMLRLMSTPNDVFEEAKVYLQIYFIGILGLMVYNMGSGILRAVGNSRYPLYFLILSAALNIILDFVFVLLFKMGVAGVAYATIISQFISATLVIYVLSRVDGPYRIIFRDIRLDREMLKKIVRVGFPSALQLSLTSFSNVFVQSYINSFGSSCMAGWSVYGKIDQFGLLPMQSISLSITTFVGQNLGAGNVKRAKKGINIALLISIISTIFLLTPIMIFSRELVWLFNREESVIQYGSLFLRLISPFYLLVCVNQIYIGSLRGAGDTKAPMVIMLSSFVLFRQIYLFIVSRTIGTIIMVALGYPFGWLLCSIAIYLYYRKTHWERI
jgi:putative MATE family efflux protein